ncbi:MAG: hypothetical protein QG556_240 [Pseudomonadota bacterium]|nr:hypothetical protein [Pseudomonadota bacterium]
MKRFNYLIVSVLLLLGVRSSIAQASQDKVSILTIEREQLYRAYQDADSQMSGLLGNRTKDDLQQSIDALKAIVDKDNEILEELANRQSKDRSEFTDKYNDLIQHNNDLTQKNRELMELNQRTEGFSKENHLILQDAQQREFLFIAIAGFMGILFLVYLTKYSMLKNKVKSQQNGANYPSES